MIFPSQTIFQHLKTPEWCSLHLDYAQFLLQCNNSSRSSMDDTYASYNGKKPAASFAYLTQLHGKKSKQQYLAYRACTTKINLIVGEFLTRPLQAFVVTNNREAKSAKMEQMEFTMGAMVAKKELEDLKTKAGVDVMEGAPIPESEEDPLWAKMSVKDKEEVIMQTILNEQIPSLNLKQKFAENLRDGALVSVVWGKIERNEKGETNYINIDPRDRICEEIKGDPHCEKSPIKGARQWLPIHEILRRCRLTPEQIKLIEDIGANPQNHYGDSIKAGANGKGLVCEVIHIEWISSIPKYFQKIKKTASQLILDPSEQYIYIELDTEKYERNKEWWDAKKDIEIVAKYRQDLWEATRIGGLKELDVNCQRCNFQMRKVDNPSYILSGSYVGFLFDTVDGERISMFQQMENWGNMLDVVMYQILKEINRYKGKIVGYNMAGLRAKGTVKEVQYDMVNDGFTTYDTSASGNFHGRDVSLSNILQVEDIGLSQSFPALIGFKNDILQMMDRMTGISENREGQIAASATATNTNSAIQASRTITEPFFFGMYSFIDKTLMKIIESTKITWAFYKLEEGEQILGIDKWKFMRVTQEIGYKDYGVHLQDGGKYREVMDFMKQQMAGSLNAKEIRPEDALAFVWAETAVEQKQILKEGWSKVKELAGQSNEANNENAMAMQQQQLQTQIEIANADREDRQRQQAEMIILQGDTDIRVNNATSSNDVIKQQHKSDLENNIDPNQTIR